MIASLVSSSQGIIIIIMSHLTENSMSEHLKIALQLSSQELRWLSELPYYIRSADLGTLFVHAGFQHGVKLQHQDPWVGYAGDDIDNVDDVYDDR
jgi:hypothetical protein